MEKIVNTIYSLIENRYNIVLETVLIDNVIMNFKLSYSNDNTLVYFTEYNTSIINLLKLSNLPVLAKEKILNLNLFTFNDMSIYNIDNISGNAKQLKNEDVINKGIELFCRKD